MPAFRVCPYMGKEGYNSVQIQKDMDEKKAAFWRSATQGFSYQTSDQNQPIPKNCQIQRGLCY